MIDTNARLGECERRLGRIEGSRPAGTERVAPERVVAALRDAPVGYKKMEEVAELLGISRSGVYRRIDDKSIRAVRVGRSVRIPSVVIEEPLRRR